jgi:hypothetical protein
MQRYSKVSLGPFITVKYNRYLETFMQGYINGSVGLLMTVLYTV